jgi:beta-lactamase class A
MKRQDFSNKRFSLRAYFQYLAIANAVAVIFLLFGLLLTQKKNTSSIISLSQSTSESTISLSKTDNLLSTDAVSLPNQSFHSLEPKSATASSSKNLPTTSSEQPRQPNQEITYQFINYPDFQPSTELQSIVNDVVKLAQKKNLPTGKISISLIDVNKSEFAGYQENKLRFPASVAKLFWMVALYGQFENRILPDPGMFFVDLSKMMKQSDNEAASRIIDRITDTKSGSELKGKQYQDWLYQRTWINRFFQKANYQDINVSQKAFPIPSEKMYEPQGRELQIRGGNSTNPIRNKISTQQAARLMYEIVTKRALSQEYSQYMMTWLDRTKELRSGSWKNIDPNFYFNPIKGFLGEYFSTISQPVSFASKAGWTSQTRQEVAYISDGKNTYILAIFAESPDYAQNWKIFPEMSKLVYQKMRDRNRK